MSTRRPFSTQFKAKGALEALRVDKTIQEIAARHKVQPNQVSVWKQRAVAGMKEVFSHGAAQLQSFRPPAAREVRRSPPSPQSQGR